MFTFWNWIKNETWEPVEHMGRWRIRHLSIQTNLLTKMCIFLWIWTVHCNIFNLLINTGELRWFYCSVTESILFILPIFNSKTLSSPVDIGIKINSLNWKWDVCVAVIFFNIDPPPVPLPVRIYSVFWGLFIPPSDWWSLFKIKLGTLLFGTWLLISSMVFWSIFSPVFVLISLMTHWVRYRRLVLN